MLTTIGAHVGVLVVDVDDKIDGIPEPAEDGVDDNEEAVDDGVDGEEPVHRPGTRSHHCGTTAGGKLPEGISLGNLFGSSLGDVEGSLLDD
mmetsp:Transcript_35913/g.41246  ORF Transcript_35913/g.41246 Transcript_35913/m.41246 type:complete len:91 (-) Transcript_35913:435-707(-)